MTIETLFEQYHVDQEHARHVADMALALFDRLGPVYGLPTQARCLLEMGALLHNVGLTTDPDRHHQVGRDIILAAEMADLSETDRAMLACLVAFHRKKVRTEEEPAYQQLDPANQDTTLRLAAILRVADGLDYSQSQTTHMPTCEIINETVQLHLTGPEAARDGKRAVKKADLWQKVFGSRLDYTLDSLTTNQDADAQAPVELPAQTATDSDALTGTHSLAAASRQWLGHHFKKLLAQEKDVHADHDIEAVHQMRVATRRLRATLAIAGEVAPTKPVRFLRKEIRRIAQTSSVVRDCDVFLGQIDGYLAGQPEEQRMGLKPLTAALQKERAIAYATLCRRLNAQRYRTFKRKFDMFVHDNLDDWDNSVRICDVAGSLIWSRYEELRAFETHVQPTNLQEANSDALHQARIAGKRLRYSLEVFADVFGPKVVQAIDPLKALQDNLGTLQDIAVAKAYVSSLDLPGSNGARAALENYIASREAEGNELLKDLPRIWEKIMNITYRRKLMDFIIRL